MDEQRFFRRINFQTEADIYIDKQPFRCDLIDLALQGALFRSETELPLDNGLQAELSIYLPESALRMDFTGELIHQHGPFYGFLFVSVDDITMGHLRRLLELNFGDSDQADREFSQWLSKGTKD
ncbi:MAG: PilZ domain-containing protein [Desulfuromonadales bacterium]|nr:PilZ domain-containing protein [Desulfuromonadales bacterium]MBN2792559.1 PilZ domain-containing protein [Desulfuromonadales bacterium]